MPTAPAPSPAIASTAALAAAALAASAGAPPAPKIPAAPLAGTPDVYLAAAHAINTLLELTALPLPGAAASSLGDACGLAHAPVLRTAADRLRAALFSFQASVLDAAPPIPRAFWDGRQLVRLGWRERFAAYHVGVPLNAAGAVSVPLAAWVSPRAPGGGGGGSAMRWRPPPQDRAYLSQMQMCVAAMEEQLAEFMEKDKLDAEAALERVIKLYDGAYTSLEAACRVIKAKRALVFQAPGPQVLGSGSGVGGGGGGGGGAGGGGPASSSAAAGDAAMGP